MYPYAFCFQVAMILALTALIVWKGKFSRYFTGIAGCFYLLYAVIQNMAITEQYGFSMVTVNVVMMIPVAIFCLWWPMDMKTALPDFSLHYLWDSGSAMGFCPMTPVFLTLLILSKKGANRIVLRVTAMAGIIIGFYNMSNFSTDAGFYLGLYHLPLLGMSTYALLCSKRKKYE